MSSSSQKFGIDGGRPYNHYRCERCGQWTCTKHEQDGVTPFLIRCRATYNCRGTAQSTFYRGPQDERQVPHLIWYRPATEAEVVVVVGAEFDDETVRERVLEHWRKGGCLSKPGELRPVERPKVRQG